MSFAEKKPLQGKDFRHNQSDGKKPERNAPKNGKFANKPANGAGFAKKSPATAGQNAARNTTAKKENAFAGKHEKTFAGKNGSSFAGKGKKSASKKPR